MWQASEIIQVFSFAWAVNWAVQSPVATAEHPNVSRKPRVVAQGEHACPEFKAPALTEKRVFSTTSVQVKAVAGGCQCRENKSNRNSIANVIGNGGITP